MGMRWRKWGSMSNWNPGVTTSFSFIASKSGDDAQARSVLQPKGWVKKEDCHEQIKQ